VFLSRDYIGNLHQVVESRGYPLLRLGGVNDVAPVPSTSPYAHWLGVSVQRDADDTKGRLAGLSVDWLVVDHYGLSADWEQSLRSIGSRIMAVDDLADRNHVVDVLLDQNLGKNESDYEGLISAYCRLLLGPRFAMLRPEFAALRNESLNRRRQGRLRKIVVTMGGVDLGNATGAVLEALNEWGPSLDLEVTVVMGHNAPWRNQVIQQTRALSFQTEVLVNVQSMAELMCDADLAIGAAGSTSWERCCLGVPSLILVLAENQHPIARALVQAGAAHLLDWTNLRASLGMAMDRLIQNPAVLLEMSNAAAEVVDGYGAERVARYLEEAVNG
jgi:UDP-2,4-diacetamido-2,4,6-trideoxy-beta-L-altropyranose hydrolase